MLSCCCAASAPALGRLLLPGQFRRLAGGFLLLALLDRGEAGLLLRRQLREQFACVGELLLDGGLGRLEVVLRFGERFEALGGLLALLHRRGLLGEVVVDRFLLTARHAVHQLGLVEVVLRGVRQEEGRRVRRRGARAVLGGCVAAEFLARVVELLGALGDVVEEGVDALALLCGLLFGRVVLLGRRLRLAVEVVDLLLDLLEARFVVRRGARVGRLGQQGDGGEGRRGEGGGPYACYARTSGTRLAVRRQGRRLLPCSAYRVSCRVRADGSEGLPYGRSPGGSRADSPQVRWVPGSGCTAALRTRRRPCGPASFAGGGRTACPAR